MTCAALIGAGGAEADPAAAEAAGAGGRAAAGALAAGASGAASAHAPIKIAAIEKRAGRGTGRILPQIARHESHQVFYARTVKLSKIHGMLAHRAKTAPTM